jgi:hypothetical protein
LRARDVAGGFRVFSREIVSDHEARSRRGAWESGKGELLTSGSTGSSCVFIPAPDVRWLARCRLQRGHSINGTRLVGVWNRKRWYRRMEQRAVVFSRANGLPVIFSWLVCVESTSVLLWNLSVLGRNEPLQGEFFLLRISPSCGMQGARRLPPGRVPSAASDDKECDRSWRW